MMATDPEEWMDGAELRDARGILGQRWVGRPLTMSEMGYVLRFSGTRPNDTVRDLERGHKKITGPISLVIDMLLSGASHPDLKPDDFLQMMRAGRNGESNEH